MARSEPSEEGRLTGAEAQQKYRLSTRRLRYLLSTKAILGLRTEDGAMWIDEASLKQYLRTHRRSVAGIQRKTRVTLKKLRYQARIQREKDKSDGR